MLPRRKAKSWIMGPRLRQADESDSAQVSDDFSFVPQCTRALPSLTVLDGFADCSKQFCARERLADFPDVQPLRRFARTGETTPKTSR